MKSFIIEKRLYKKAIIIFPFWVLSLIFWFGGGDVFTLDSCVTTYTNSTSTISKCNSYIISKYSELNEKSQLYEFNSSYLLYQMIPIFVLICLPLIGRMYILASVLKADVVKKAFSIFGTTMILTIPSFLMVSLLLFPFGLKDSICSDLKRHYIVNNFTKSFISSSSICGGGEFNLFKGEISDYTNSSVIIDPILAIPEPYTTVNWYINFQWYFIIASIVFSFCIVVLAIALLAIDSNVKSTANNKQYSLFEQEYDEEYDDENINDVIEEGLKLFGRNIWYPYTKPNLSIYIISIFQFLFISCFISLFYFGFKYYTIPFFLNLLIIFISYYFLIFDGMRDNYLIKRMYKENCDLVQFVNKVKSTEPKVAYVKKQTKELDGDDTPILTPKVIKSWKDNSDPFDHTTIDQLKPTITQITFTEEYKTNIKLPPSFSLLFVKSDLPNYFIFTNSNSKNTIKLNRPLHAFLVFMGVSCIYKLIFFNRKVVKMNFTLKTTFECTK